LLPVRRSHAVAAIAGTSENQEGENNAARLNIVVRTAF
jgi:hypothetical protein